jgi:two-component system, cell cycle sensor histidine kinase and response regulator CckA
LPIRILIVDDEQIIAEDLAVQVSRMGHEVVGISISGEEAIAVADQTKPDLVFMDIKLEGQMTGVESARVIQKRTSATVVFITAYPGVLLRDSADLEAEICVHKPFTRTQLESALQKAAAIRQSNQDVNRC